MYVSEVLHLEFIKANCLWMYVSQVLHMMFFGQCSCTFTIFKVFLTFFTPFTRFHACNLLRGNEVCCTDVGGNEMQYLESG